MTVADTVLLVTAHGTPATLDELPAFLTNIRRGRPAPPEVLAEVTRRYTAIGGHSPLTAITRAQADALALRTGFPAHVAMRLWHPYPRDVLTEIAATGARRVVSVPAAPYSVHVYNAAVREAAQSVAPQLEIREIGAWNRAKPFIDGLAASIQRAIDPSKMADVRVVLTAHSLPTRAIDGGDPYATLVAQTAADVMSQLDPHIDWTLAYQSQGMTGDAWLGPDLRSAFRAARDAARTSVLVAPIGFVADHVETLYDLDIEARALAADLGLTFARTGTLDASPALIDAMALAVDAAL